MKDLIIEARKLCERAEILVNELHTERIDYDTEYLPLIDAIQTIPELCDALENTEKQLQEQFDKAGAWLEEHNEMKIALENANAEIEQLREAQRWIPVTERLPTGCGYYLSVVERIAPDELGGNNTRVKIMRWLGADWRYPTHIPKWINEAITETVTHWMPLPEPPKKGE